MEPFRWYRLSGDAPDLGLSATPTGTRYLIDNDPARDARLNPPRTLRERLRRAAGRAPLSPWHGTVGFAALTECWNSAALATRVGRSGAMICFGGGHNDYFGSDVHQFDFATRRWCRISDGYTSGRPDEYGSGAVYPDAVYPDGSPLPPHTYDYLQYDPVGNDLLLLKGQKVLGPQVEAIPIPHLFNLDDRLWRRGPEHPDARLNSGGFSTWDARRRRLWGHSGDDGGGNGLTWYAPDGVSAAGLSGAWGPRYPNKLPGRANHNVMRMDPDRDLVLVAVHTAAAFFVMDPEHPEAAIERVVMQGGPRLQPCAGLEYSTTLGGFVYFSAQEDGTFHVIYPPDAHWRTPGARWRWNEIPAARGSIRPVDDARVSSRYSFHPGHVFGRFRVVDYAEGTSLAALIRHVDSPVYAAKLSPR